MDNSIDKPIRDVCSLLKEYFGDAYSAMQICDENAEADITVKFFSPDKAITIKAYWDEVDGWRVGNAEFGPELTDETALVSIIHEMTRQRTELRGALRDLMDVQNGPPLVRHEHSWHQAMRRADQILQVVELD